MAVDHRVGEELLHDRGGRRPDFGRQGRAHLAGPQQLRQFLRGQMVRVGVPLPGPLRARVGGDELVVGRVEADFPAAAPHPQALPDEAERRGVEGLLEDDVAVAMERGPLPERQVVGRRRQREELRPLHRGEAVKGRLLRGAVPSQPGGRLAPGAHVGVRPGQCRRRPAPEEVALDVVDPALLDLPFMLGRPRGAGGEEEAVVLGTFPVGRLDLRVVEAGPGDARLEVIQHDPLRHRPEERERLPMEGDPGRQRLVPGERHILMAAVGQRHHERPGLAALPGRVVEQVARVPEVHLRLAPGRPFHPHRRVRRGRRELMEEAVDGGQAPGVAPLPEALPDRHPLHPAGVELQHHVAIGLDRRDGLRRRRRGQGLPGEPVQDLERRQRPGQEPLLGRPGPVAHERPPIQPRRPLNRAQVGGGLQMPEDLPHIHEIDAPSRHTPSWQSPMTHCQKDSHTARRATRCAVHYCRRLCSIADDYCALYPDN